MRYLIILWAFLTACQSSKNQAEKFALLNQSLESSLIEARLLTYFAEKNIRKDILKTASGAESNQVMVKLSLLNKKASIILLNLEQMKEKIKGKSPQEAEKIMLGESQNKDGLAYILAKKLNDYREFLLQEGKELGITEADLPILIQGNYNHPLYKDSGLRDLDFAHSKFQNLPTEAMLALLTNFQTEVVAYQQELVKKYTNDNHRFEPKFQFYIQPKSSVFLEEGQDFEAEVSMVRLSHLIHNQQLVINGQKLTPNAISVDLYEKILDSPGLQHLKIEYKGNYRGRDSVYKVDFPYYVFPK
jgi:hypothetical protein